MIRNEELWQYLDREECNKLTKHQKNLLARFVAIYGKDYPVGRPLAIGMTKLNSKNKNVEYIPQAYISWLYYY